MSGQAVVPCAFLPYFLSTPSLLSRSAILVETSTAAGCQTRYTALTAPRGDIHKHIGQACDPVALDMHRSLSHPPPHPFTLHSYHYPQSSSRSLSSRTSAHTSSPSIPMVQPAVTSGLASVGNLISYPPRRVVPRLRLLLVFSSISGWRTESGCR